MRKKQQHSLFLLLLCCLLLSFLLSPSRRAKEDAASSSPGIPIVFTPGVHGRFTLDGARNSGNRELELPILSASSGLLQAKSIPSLQTDANWHFAGWDVERVAGENAPPLSVNSPNLQEGVPEPDNVSDTSRNEEVESTASTGGQAGDEEAPLPGSNEDLEPFSIHWYEDRFIFPMRYYSEPVPGRLYSSEELLNLRFIYRRDVVYRITARYRHVPHGLQSHVDGEKKSMIKPDPIPRVGETSEFPLPIALCLLAALCACFSLKRRRS